MNVAVVIGRGLLIWGCLFVSVPLLADPPENAVIGWATEGAGTTGGRGGSDHEVTTAEQLKTALKTAGPKIIKIRGTIELTADLRVPSDTSLIGTSADAKLNGGGLHLRDAHNVVVQNLTIRNAVDAINIEGSHHVWIDHCDLAHCQDGLVDIKRGSDFITVSWNHFHDHRKTCLLGHSDKDEIREIDRGHLRVTYHHNFFDGSQTRHPRVRFAEGVHVLNNYFRRNEYGVASVMDAGVLVEGNVFEEVKQPTLISYGDSPAPGRLVERNNVFIRSGKPETRGTVATESLKYRYHLDDAATIAAAVVKNAGPKLAKP